MAYSFQAQIATQAQTNIDVNLKYLSKDDLYLTINGVEQTLNEDYSWVSDTVIQLATPLKGGETVKVVRITDKRSLWIAFAEGVPFDRNNLDEQNTQFLYIAQEISEGANISGFFTSITMNGNFIHSLASPIEDTDAANKKYVDKYTSAAIASGNKAEEAAKEAATAAEEAQAALKRFEEIYDGTIKIVNTVNGASGDITINASIEYDSTTDYAENTVGYQLKDTASKVDSIDTLTTQVEDLDTKVSGFTEWKDSTRFTLIYPNNGTKESPANVAANTRYVMSNPFPNDPVIVLAEIYLNGVWGDSGWFWTQFGFGTKASHILETDQIIIQTGGNVGHNLSAYTGSPHGSTVNSGVTTAPCRVKVWRII